MNALIKYEKVDVSLIKYEKVDVSYIELYIIDYVCYFIWH